MMLSFISGIGGGELLIIFILFLMLFGSKKLPGIARNLGKTMADLHRAAREVREEFLNADRELNTPAPSGGTSPDVSTDHGEWHPDMDGYGGEGGPVSPSGEGNASGGEVPAADPSAAASPAPESPAPGTEAAAADEADRPAEAESGAVDAGCGGAETGVGDAPVAGGDGTGDDGSNRQV